MVKVTTNGALALQDALEQAEALASKPQLNKQEERQYNLLLSKISLIKAGFTPKEIAGIERERLTRSLGVANVPVPYTEESEREWRQFFATGQSRQVPIILKNEVQRFEERAAQAAGTESITFTAPTSGGTFVPQGFYDKQLASMKAYDEIFDDANCNILESATGGPAVVPAVDDVANAAQLITENTDPGQGATFKAYNNQLAAYSFRSGMVFCSIEILQDSGLAIGALLERAFALRHARGVGAYLITGSGSSQPTGLITAGVATGNIVVAAGSAANDGGSETGANSIGTDDLVTLYGKLNRAYRRNAVFAMSDDTLVTIMKLLDKQGRPVVDIRDGLPTLFGKRIAVCPSMSDISASAYTVAVYDPSYFLQRRIAAGSYVRRFTNVAGAPETGAVAFQSFYRTDSNLSVPNTTYPPIAILQQHS